VALRRLVCLQACRKGLRLSPHNLGRGSLLLSLNFLFSISQVESLGDENRLLTCSNICSNGIDLSPFNLRDTSWSCQVSLFSRCGFDGLAGRGRNDNDRRYSQSQAPIHLSLSLVDEVTPPRPSQWHICSKVRAFFSFPPDHST